MAVVAIAWIVVRLVLVRYTDWPLLRVAIFGAATLAVLSVVVLPAYDDTTVIERMPTPLPVASETPTTAPATREPMALRSAPIHGIDHRAVGTVVIYRQPDDSFLIGLEDIDIQPGPDYDVYLVPGADREDPEGGLRLDDLRGNKGTQYYAAPAGTDVATGEWTVLVWCQTFEVPVAAATPVPGGA
jgi:hypothetical protein